MKKQPKFKDKKKLSVKARQEKFRPSKTRSQKPRLEQAMDLLRKMHAGFMQFMDAPQSGYGERGHRYDWEKEVDCFLKGIPFKPDKIAPPPEFMAPEEVDNPVKAHLPGEQRTIHRNVS